MKNNRITVIGGGLAGCEAAWQASKRGCSVTIYEMRPDKTTGAHETDYLGEIVCSNSLGSDAPLTASRILKEELRKFDSLIMAAADGNRVPAGQALAVDRELFGQYLTEKIENNPNIEVVRQEIKSIPEGEGITVIATGPLTSDSLAADISRCLGENELYFFDAQAPIVDLASVDMNHAFWASRYDKGDPDYLNCSMNKEEYDAFYDALISAELTPMHEFESNKLFESCMPIEEMARRGRQTMLFGPLKPVGIIDPSTGERPHAVLQLRKENLSGTALNLVGFQTRLKWSEQKKVFGMIPALSHAEYLRYGVMHRNTYINGPKFLASTMQLKNRPNIFFAGQITGVEGYLESCASGLLAGINASKFAEGRRTVVFPNETAIGALAHHVSTEQKGTYQPSNINFGLLPEPEKPFKKNERRSLQVRICENTIMRVFEDIYNN